MVNFGRLGRKVKEISRNAEKEESFGTGLIGEKLIISLYRAMSLDQLEKMRYIINKIIKKKKEMRRVDEHNRQMKNKEVDVNGEEKVSSIQGDQV